MKRKELTLAAVLAMIACLAAPSAIAVTETEAKDIQKAVAQVRLPEMAPTTAKLVKNAPEKERLEVAIIALKAIAEKHPAVVASVVGAIAKANPELSEAIAAEAAALVPEEAPAIAKAAASATPEKAAKIAAAVIAPEARKRNIRVAHEVAGIVPALTSSIIDSVQKADPTTSGGLESLRVTLSAASSGGGSGTISTAPGTISGGDLRGRMHEHPGTITSSPGSVIGGTPAAERANPPTAISAVSGADPDRANYGVPQ